MEDNKSNKLLNIAVVVLVVLIVTEAGYFLYTRYVGPLSFPWKNMTKVQTSDQVVDYKKYNNSRGLAEDGTELPPSQISKTKLDEVLGLVEIVPPKALGAAKMLVSVKGVVNKTVIDSTEIEGVAYPMAIEIITPEAATMKLRFSQEEMENMIISEISKELVVTPKNPADIGEGQYVVINIESNLLEWRKGKDKVSIEIREDKRMI